MLVPLLLNWYANPYHTPLMVAKEKGFYEEYDIDLCLLEPTNPSDVTKVVGEGIVPLGLKAMVHCFAARNRGYPIQSIGTILDEPPTGLVTPINTGIESIADIPGKRLGYVGEFGKVMIDQLANEAGIPNDAYETIRTGMEAANAIIQNKVDAAIGLSCFQQLEVEEAGLPTRLIRIDKAADLGCCCFCSILMIGHQDYINQNPKMLKNLMSATLKGVELTRELPQEAFECLIKIKPQLDNSLFRKIFNHTLPFFSKDCLNVERDWEKVQGYAKKLGILEKSDELKAYYTNRFIPMKSSQRAA